MQPYPGSYDYWQIVWVQIVLFVYIQLTTALTLYNQKNRYSAFITKPLGKVLPWSGRDLLIKIHAANGIIVFSLNVLCTLTWFYLKLSGSLSLWDIMLGGGETSVIGWVNVLVTSFMSLMLVFGVSLYKNNNPLTTLPFWRFEYYLSRLVHRLVFFALLAVLGYHIFYINKIYTAWIDWTVKLHPFSLIFLGTIIVGCLAFALAFVMLIEIPKGEMFTGEKRRLSIPLYLSAIAVTAFAISCLTKPFDHGFLAGIVITIAVIPGLLGLIPKSTPRAVVVKKLKTPDFLDRAVIERSEAAEEVINYTIEAWRNGEDWKSIVDYCGTLFLRLQKEKPRDLKELNQVEDTGKAISMLTLNRLRELELASSEGMDTELVSLRKSLLRGDAE